MAPRALDLQSSEARYAVPDPEDRHVDLGKHRPNLSSLRIRLIRNDQARRASVVLHDRLQPHAGECSTNRGFHRPAWQIEQRAIRCNALLIDPEAFVTESDTLDV